MPTNLDDGIFPGTGEGSAFTDLRPNRDPCMNLKSARERRRRSPTPTNLDDGIFPGPGEARSALADLRAREDSNFRHSVP